MLRAAHEAICEQGYAATTMEAIARRADVAVQTLYFTFRTKAAILEEVVHAAVVGFDRWSPSLGADVQSDHVSVLREKAPWFHAFEAEPDQAKALRTFVEATCTILERTAPLLARVPVRSDPELAAWFAGSERLRAEGAGFLVRGLRKKGPLREGFTAARAADVFLVLTSTETYHQLTVERGWSPAQFRRWLVEVLSQQLLPATRHG